MGTVESGISYNGSPARTSNRLNLAGATVLASRSEVKRNEWKPFANAPFEIVPMGSVAYKLARVAAGLSDLTFTLTPKHEWDVAAGAALVLSGGGFVSTLENTELRCNQKNPLLSGLIACGPNMKTELMELLDAHLKPAART